MAVFDIIAKDYDEWYKGGIGKFADQAETCLAFNLFSPEKHHRVLDVGCGTGNFSLKLAGYGCEVTGIDLSEEMLAQARHKAEGIKPEMLFKRMDVYNLEFPDNHFDGVFSMAAFEFITQPGKAYSEMFRVLKPGGRLLIGTINRDSKWGELYLSKSFQENSVFKYASFMTMEQLKDLDRENLKGFGECLFIPPDAGSESISWEEEKRLSLTERGGFICAIWEKPL
jgi:ubiquinone/menaquinone biosynthesis C-methylase UbiE